MRFSWVRVVVGMAPLAAWGAADPAGKLTLSPDFRLADIERLPVGVRQPGLLYEVRPYPTHNACEWQVRVRAPDGGESVVLENPPSADFDLSFPSKGPISLYWSKGSHSETSDFRPHVETLNAGTPFALESIGGRSSDGALPYFNLASGGGGLIVAVGWTGDWNTSIQALPEGKVRIRAGLKRARFGLRAVEGLRLPSVLIMGYRGDWLDGQNRFRRLMLEHFTPTTHGPMTLMPVAASVHGMIGFNDTTETNLVALAQEIGKLKLPIDTFWLDAGWNEGGFPRGQGNPQPDPTRFPRGLRPVGQATGAAGLRFLVWFEPERVMRGTWFEREKRQWLLQPSACPPEYGYQERDGFFLLDFGNEAARREAFQRVSDQVRAAGIDVYRQDFNAYPAYFWHTGEPAEAVGLREVRYINGLYEFLDELPRRHPGLVIDNCASGGRRLDFEMMRRSVALWRSDSCWGDKDFPRNVQAMTHGLSLWLPLHGLGAAATDSVALRSGMGACASYAINYRDGAAVEALRQHLTLYVKARHLYTKDFYPLTPWTINPAELLAFQFHDPSAGEGLVQAFQGKSPARSEVRLRLRGLDPLARYRFTDWDSPREAKDWTGAELFEPGFQLPMRGREAVVIGYSRVVPQ